MPKEQFPKRYRIEFIEPGICNYEDVEQGVVYIGRDALNRMRPTYIGKPVVNKAHRDLKASEAFKLTDEEKMSIADGVVYDCGWLENGWSYADVMIWNIPTQENIASGYSASCAYKPTEVDDGGNWHGFEYDEEVINGVYTHMAIVDDPRYERAKIYELPGEYKNAKAEELWQSYLNSKEKKMKWKFLSRKNNKTNETVGEETQTKEMNIDESYVEVDGEKVPMAELIKTWQGEQAEKQISENVMNPEDEIEVDGKKVKAQELIDSYRRNKAKKNEMEEGEKENEMEEDEDEEEDKKEEKEQKKNNFKKLDNAHKNHKENYTVVISTKSERVATGKAKYGTKE